MTKKDLWTPREKAIRWFFGRASLAAVGMSFTVGALEIESIGAMFLITCFYFVIVHYFFEYCRLKGY